MSEASFEKRSDQEEEEEGPENASDSPSQSEDSPNSISDDTHMTEIDINDSSEARTLHSRNGESSEDEAREQACSNNAVHKDAQDHSRTSSTEPAEDAVPVQSKAKVTLPAAAASRLILSCSLCSVWSVLLHS